MYIAALILVPILACCRPDQNLVIIEDSSDLYLFRAIDFVEPLLSIQLPCNARKPKFIIVLFLLNIKAPNKCLTFGGSPVGALFSAMRCDRFFVKFVLNSKVFSRLRNLYSPMSTQRVNCNLQSQSIQKLELDHKLQIHNYSMKEDFLHF